jgi:hypothetical protein
MMKALGYSGELVSLPNENHKIVKFFDVNGDYYCDATNGSPYNYQFNNGRVLSGDFCWRLN